MAEDKANARLEAFCDGVFAIALTLLIIDVKLPATASVTSTPELWRALRNLAPSVFAFVLSFGIILITWVNHHGILKLVSRSSAAFIYANGLLLLTVVSIPFSTGLLGTFLLTDHAAPAVLLYNAILALQAIAWLLVTGTALKHQLTADERSTAMLRQSNSDGYFAFLFYSLLAVAAVWFPLEVAVVTTLSWLYWLTIGIRVKHGGTDAPDGRRWTLGDRG